MFYLFTTIGNTIKISALFGIDIGFMWCYNLLTRKEYIMYKVVKTPIKANTYIKADERKFYLHKVDLVGIKFDHADVCNPAMHKLIVVHKGAKKVLMTATSYERLVEMYKNLISISEGLNQSFNFVEASKSIFINMDKLKSFKYNTEDKNLPLCEFNFDDGYNFSVNNLTENGIDALGDFVRVGDFVTSNVDAEATTC